MMSKDLLELDAYYQPNGKRTSPVPQQAAAARSTPKSLKQALEPQVQVEDDDFGDFQTSQRQEGRSHHINAYTAALSSNGGDPPRKAFESRDKNVLFDAEDEEQEDDFGGFEGATHHSHVQPQPLSVAATPKHPGKSSEQELTLIDFEEYPAKDHSPPAASQPTASLPLVQYASKPRSSSAETGTERDDPSSNADMRNLASESPEKTQPIASLSLTSHKEGTQLARKSCNEEQMKLPALLAAPEDVSGSPPPTNIPPPALLFTLFPPILRIAQEKLFGPLSRHGNTSPTRASMLGNCRTQGFLDSLSVIGTVLGHILAGRKLRWKRDTILNQSMRIGPASASRSGGGMKLTTLDRSESTKEEREAADVLKVWRHQAGRLRSAVGKVTPLPELSEVLPVRTALQNEGAIASLKPCALCGLRRNERVQKVDYNVQDSFGEWWVEHWGHRACMNFWGVQSGNLKARV